jgi:Autophagy protein Atg8 ubiquitin like
VEYENYRFKYPSLIALVVESINVKVIENQKIIGKFFYRFHVSEDLLISELADIMKFKINTKIREEEDKLGPKERVLFFNNRLSVSDAYAMKDLYEKCHENDGWLYLDFIIDSIVV